jgi:hypothetical protein
MDELGITLERPAHIRLRRKELKGILLQAWRKAGLIGVPMGTNSSEIFLLSLCL